MSAQESAADQQPPASSTDAELSSHQESHQEDLMMEAPDSPPDLYAHNYSFSDTPVTTPSKSVAPQDKINHGSPGSSWTSKKFREEYDRAWDALVDRNWDGKKYGDPLVKA
ncbi:5e86d77e-1ec0-4bea-b748-283f758c186d [Sclerotinia trifoliorum]|uniref:5e86d77e-1ec0-4bea-b748-283f758c186d n=1 Tax=Sclerotinia trifoliorum TaxID=28548 RepID=A0A8H2VZW2_9HELO|nr:5e86d77e-1ec0-4bea-b748-283f758c186d [Sclerotinia trifoliorum]